MLAADSAFLGWGLTTEVDDGVVVVAVGLGSVAASAVVGVALGVFLAADNVEPCLSVLLAVLVLYRVLFSRLRQRFPRP